MSPTVKAWLAAVLVFGANVLYALQAADLVPASGTTHKVCAAIAILLNSYGFGVALRTPTGETKQASQSQDKQGTG